VAHVKELLNIGTGIRMLGVVKGYRSNHCFVLTKIYLKFCTPKQALKILSRWNEKNRPPLPEEEIKSIINSMK
jgi:hypothetical protein